MPGKKLADVKDGQSYFISSGFQGKPENAIVTTQSNTGSRAIPPGTVNRPLVRKIKRSG